jgi:Na+/H+-dicarboxylate symporter
MLFKQLQHRSVQTILVIGFYAAFAQFLPDTAHRSFYTISIFIKDLLLWMMPVTVFVFIAHTISSFERKAPIFILTLVLFEAMSNFLSVWYAMGSGFLVSTQFSGFEIIKLDSEFSVLWRLPFVKPSWWGADKGSFAGLLLGCYIALSPSAYLKPILEILRSVMEFILTKVFARFIPLFVLGFIAQIYKTGMLDHMIAHYSILIVYLVGFISLYITLIFAVGANFNPKVMVQHIKNLLPAGGISLTSGCSLSTMPWTIKGASMNLENPALARAIIPATTNIQQIGDCITNAFLCFLIYKHFNGYAPDIKTLVIFSGVFVAARFATAAVLGGAIFIMIPIYQTYLGFNDEMVAIILAMNVILDPIVTSSNVMANGGLARVFEKVWTTVYPQTSITVNKTRAASPNYRQ